MSTTPLAPDHSSDETLGALLRRERQRQGLSLRDLARLLGASPATVSNWEHDVIVPRSKNLVRLSRVLEISTQELYRAAGIEMPHDAASVSAMLRAGYDNLSLEAIADIERYIARTVERYGATKKPTT